MPWWKFESSPFYGGPFPFVACSSGDRLDGGAICDPRDRHRETKDCPNLF